MYFVARNTSPKAESALPRLNQWLNRTLRSIVPKTPVYSVAWSPDGKTLASGSRDNTVKLWEAATGKVLATLSGHTDYLGSVLPGLADFPIKRVAELTPSAWAARN